jgi:membrane-associated phospholipid phosphatase
MRLRSVDLLTLGYVTPISIFVLVDRNRVESWPTVEIAFLAVIAAVVTFQVLDRMFPDSAWVSRLRVMYPLALVPMLYLIVGRYSLLFHATFLDATVNRFELAVFGVHPNLLLDHLVSRPMTELMTLAYISYYGYFIVPPLVLAVRGRDRDLERYVFALTLALYVCYLSFLVVPLAGPVYTLRNSFQPALLHGYLVTPVVRAFMASADPLGACFPSAHVAGSWAAVLCLRRTFRPVVFRCVAPFTLLLTVAVVYSRYHYLVDALAGLVVAVLSAAVAHRLFRPHPAAPPTGTGETGHADRVGVGADRMLVR